MQTKPAPFHLRPYQKAAVNAVVSRFKTNGERKMLLYLPTGAGKTVIATFIIKALRGAAGPAKKTLFVAHRQEILDQTARTLKCHLPELDVQIEQGDRKASVDADITVASVQSLVKRKERYDPKTFGLVICDECHRALAPSWEEVIGYFFAEASEGSLLLGMTATPRRSDGKSASEVFGEPAFEISRTDLEDLGFLVPMHYFTVQSDLALDRVKLSGGDFQVGALTQVMNAPQCRALAVKAWLEQGKGKKTIVFCAGVEHAASLALDFQSLGIAAEKIDGKSKDRNDILDRFRSGALEVLTNYGVLTEGFDDPGVHCILMARPTTSPLVYTQCIGRGLRCAPGKKACTVIDLVDRSTHQLQYDAVQMAGLPTKWRCRGGDPFREAQALRGIKVTSPEAFLRIRSATSLSEVQAILMSLPPNVAVAGLDGQPVLRYAQATETTSQAAAEQEAKRLLRQAQVRGAKLAVTDDVVLITFRLPETENEFYSPMKWHLEQATGRRVEFAPSNARRANNPRALLRSMLPEGCRISAFEPEPSGSAIEATITGLVPSELDALAKDFLVEYGVALNVKGQMALF
ncbi:MAG TPA: DEAD/DEAH box helicase [Polyangiaceae bacterium]